MDIVKVTRKPDGKVLLSQIVPIRVSNSMPSSRRRMRAFLKHVRRELELQFEGLTFKRCEVVFTKHNARIHIEPDANGMRVLTKHFNPAV